MRQEAAERLDVSLQQEPSQEDVLAMNFTFACLKVSLQLLRLIAQLPYHAGLLFLYCCSLQQYIIIAMVHLVCRRSGDVHLQSLTVINVAATCWSSLLTQLLVREPQAAQLMHSIVLLGCLPRWFV